MKSQTDASEDQLFDPNNWTGVQLMVGSAWDGNTVYNQATKKATPTSASQPGAGQIVWAFVSGCANGATSHPIGTVQGACGNSHGGNLPHAISPPAPQPSSSPCVQVPNVESCGKHASTASAHDPVVSGPPSRPSGGNPPPPTAKPVQPPPTVAPPVAPPVTSPPTAAPGSSPGTNCGNPGQPACGGGVPQH